MIRTSLDVPLLSPTISNTCKYKVYIIVFAITTSVIWGTFGYVLYVDIEEHLSDECNVMYIVVSALVNIIATLFAWLFMIGNKWHHKTKSLFLELLLVAMTPIYGLMMLYSSSECVNKKSVGGSYLQTWFIIITVGLVVLLFSLIFSLIYWICLGKRVEFGESDIHEISYRESETESATNQLPFIIEEERMASIA